MVSNSLCIYSVIEHSPCDTWSEDIFMVFKFNIATLTINVYIFV